MDRKPNILFILIDDMGWKDVSCYGSSFYETPNIDRLYEEGATRPRVMSIAIHPYISGQPHRIKYLEEVYAHINAHPGVIHWNGAEIYRWYKAQANVHP